VKVAEHAKGLMMETQAFEQREAGRLSEISELKRERELAQEVCHNLQERNQRLEVRLRKAVEVSMAPSAVSTLKRSGVERAFNEESILSIDPDDGSAWVTVYPVGSPTQSASLEAEGVADSGTTQVKKGMVEGEPPKSSGAASSSSGGAAEGATGYGGLASKGKDKDHVVRPR